MTITYNLMHLAYQGDISRVFTFMTGHEASDRAYGHIGIPEQHHTISHHGNDPEKLAKYAKIATYQIAEVRGFPREAEGDERGRRNTAGSLGSVLGQRHEQRQRARPEQSARSASWAAPNGRLKGNRHIVAKDTPTANLLLAIAHVGGAEIDKLGASTGRVDL